MKKIIIVGAICFLLLSTVHVVSADDNEEIKERLEDVITELYLHMYQISGNYSNLYNEGYPIEDPAMVALLNAAEGLFVTIEDLFDVCIEIGVKSNKEVKNDLSLAILDFECHQRKIANDYFDLLDDEYPVDHPVMLALNDAHDRLTEPINELKDICDSIIARSRSTFANILSKVFENNPNLFRLIQLIFKL